MEATIDTPPGLCQTTLDHHSDSLATLPDESESVMVKVLKPCFLTFSGFASSNSMEVIRDAMALGMRAEINKRIFLTVSSWSSDFSKIPEAILQNRTQHKQYPSNGPMCVVSYIEGAVCSFSAIIPLRFSCY